MAIENINEVKTYLEANKDNEEIKNYIGGLITADRVENFLNTEDGKKLLQPKMDAYATKAIKSHDEKFKANELPKLISEAVAKANPQETPEQKMIRELTERIEKSEKDSQRKDLTNKALKIAQDKKLPVQLIDYLIGDSEESTESNLTAIEKVFSTHIEAVVAERLKGNYVPPAGGGGGKPPDKNPWSKEHFNLTEQGRILKENPEFAKTLQATAKK